METIKFCPNCGHPVQGNSRFCQECGAPLSDTGAAPATRGQSWQENAPVLRQQPQSNMAVVPNQQPRNINISMDVTPPEERNDAMEMKRAAKTGLLQWQSPDALSYTSSVREAV